MRSRIAYFGVFTALALIFSYVETLIPISFGIPGMKLGLANVAVVIAMFKMNMREVYLLSVARVVLAGFLFGNLFSILYSLAGGLLSLTMMLLLRKTNRFSIYGMSMAGGVFHNIGQLIMAVFVLESFSIAYYVPVLMISGLITGMVIGIISNATLQRIRFLQIK